MSNPSGTPVKGSVKNLLLWLGFLLIFLGWSVAINELSQAILLYYFPSANLPHSADAIRAIILWAWPILFVGTAALFVFGALIVRGARIHPESLQFRSRRVILSTMLLALSLYGIERLIVLVRLFLANKMPSQAVLLGILFALIWTAFSSWGLFVWLRGYWEEHRRAQKAWMLLTAGIVSLMLLASYGILRVVTVTSTAVSV